MIRAAQYPISRGACLRWVVLLLGLLSAVPVHGAEVEHLYNQLTRGVFRLQVHVSMCAPEQNKSEELLVNAGTGFFVSDYLGKEPMLWAVTARHVVDEAKVDLIAKVRLESGGSKREAWLSLPKSNWFVLSQEEKEGFFPTDVAVMPIQIPDGYGYKSFTLCQGDNCPEHDPPKTGRLPNHLREDPKVLEHVLLLGFPTESPDWKALALEPFARAGIVAFSSRDVRIPMGTRPMVDLDAYVIDAFGWSGNSGGPVMSEKGIRLLGLLSGSHLKVHDWSIITPVSSILRTLDCARHEDKAPVSGWRKEYPLVSRSCETR